MNEQDSRDKGPKSDPTRDATTRREPVFSDFDDDEAYEESDRDRDFASAYEVEEPEEDEYDYEPEDDDGSDEDMDWQPLAPAQGIAEAAAGRPSGNPWDVPQADEDDEPLKPVPRRTQEPDEAADDDYEEEDWDEEEYGPEEQQAYQDEERHGWPLGLIVVAVVALVLLAAGGYGVVQQRAATQDEIRQLQAALATAASPAEVSQTREVLQEMEQANARLLASIEALTLENRRLQDTVAGLETQLAAQQPTAAPVEPKPSPPPKSAAKPKPAATPKPASTPKPAARPATGSATGGEWFVNFSSYGQRAAAENWVTKIKPSAGKAVVQPTTSAGKTLYRVRVVGLASRAEAEKVAAQLQAAHGVAKLWVGSE